MGSYPNPENFEKTLIAYELQKDSQRSLGELLNFNEGELYVLQRCGDQALHALKYYKEPTVALCTLFGDVQEFQEVIKLYSPHSVAAMWSYFEQHHVALAGKHLIRQGIQWFRTGEMPSFNLDELTPVERALYAIQKLHTEGHRFLSGFDFPVNGPAKVNYA